MNAEQRDLQNWYLSTMGVERYVLRGSGDSESGEASATDPALAESQASPKAPFKPPEAEPGKSELSSTSDGKPSTLADTPTKESDLAGAAVSEDSADAKSEPTVAFNLVAWHPVDDILVINDLGTGGQSGPAHSRLLSNILRAIRVELQGGVLPASIPLSWPDKSGDASATGARIMLSTFLQARIEKRGVCWVIMMGENTPDFFSSADSGSVLAMEKDKSARIQLPGGATGILTPSLDDMLVDPNAKRRTWAAIKGLAERGESS